MFYYVLYVVLPSPGLCHRMFDWMKKILGSSDAEAHGPRISIFRV